MMISKWIRIPFEIVYSQITKFKLFFFFLHQNAIKIVSFYRGSKKEISSENASFSLLQIRFFIIKVFLQRREQEPDKNIRNSQL